MGWEECRQGLLVVEGTGVVIPSGIGMGEGFPLCKKLSVPGLETVALLGEETKSHALIIAPGKSCVDCIHFEERL